MINIAAVKPTVMKRFGFDATIILWRRPQLPFGPPLAIGAALYVLYGDVPLYAWLADLVS